MPEVSDNEQIIFEHKLAVAQTRETAIQYHLESVIQTVDDNMWDKIIATTDLIQQEIEGDLIEQIETTLTEANNERLLNKRKHQKEEERGKREQQRCLPSLQEEQKREI